jgi:hypothetical protein
MIDELVARLDTSVAGAAQALSERDILWMLCHVVRYFTLDQIAELRSAHCEDPREITRQWVRRQERKHGLLDVTTAMLQPILALDNPLHIHTPGNAMPNCDSLAWKAQARWRSATPRPTLVVTATQEARRHFDDSLPLRRMRQTDLAHDACVSQLYVNLIESDPISAASWIPEDRLYQSGCHNFGQRIPDAIVTHPRVTLIEFLGKYSAKRIGSYHREFSDYHYAFY